MFLTWEAYNIITMNKTEPCIEHWEIFWYPKETILPKPEICVKFGYLHSVIVYPTRD